MQHSSSAIILPKVQKEKLHYRIALNKRPTPKKRSLEKTPLFFLILFYKRPLRINAPSLLKGINAPSNERKK